MQILYANDIIVPPSKYLFRPENKFSLPEAGVDEHGGGVEGDEDRVPQSHGVSVAVGVEPCFLSSSCVCLIKFCIKKEAIWIFSAINNGRKVIVPLQRCCLVSCFLNVLTFP